MDQADKIGNQEYMRSRGDRRVAPVCLEDMISQQDNLVEDDSEEQKGDPPDDSIYIPKPAVEA